MIGDLLYRCPLCGAFDWIEHDHCVSCSADVRIISRSQVAIGGQVQPLSHWYARILAHDLPETDDGVIMRSAQVRLSRETQEGMYWGFAGITAFHFTRPAIGTGRLSLTDTGLRFHSTSGLLDIPFDRLLGAPIESNTVIIISREHGPLFFDFLEESGKKGEDLIRKSLQEAPCAQGDPGGLPPYQVSVLAPGNPCPRPRPQGAAGTREAVVRQGQKPAARGAEAHRAAAGEGAVFRGHHGAREHPGPRAGGGAAEPHLVPGSVILGFFSPAGTSGSWPRTRSTTTRS